MMWLKKAMGLEDMKRAPDPTMTNPIGWSSIHPPQVVTNQPATGFRELSESRLPGAERPLFKDELEAARNYSLKLFEDASNAAGMSAGAGGGSAARMLASRRAISKPPPSPRAVGKALAEPQGIRAFHGSPHTFDKFDIAKLGTGEGAQAYGHGLYFAGNENVAKSYKNALSGAGNARVTGGMSPVEEFIFDRISQNADDFSIIKDLGRRYGGSIGFDEAQAALDKVRSLNKGSMYEVNLRTSPDRLLDWDKPLSQQPQAVRDALGKVPWADAYVNSERLTGGQIAPKVPEGAAQLRQAGIDGIQYLDGGSRTAGEGSRNYVMFDDSLVEILRRYGLLGILGGGAAAQGGEQ